MDFHEIAEQYPLMPAFELGRMEQDMRDGGYDARFPVVRFDGKILDGRNRFICAQRAGIEPTFVDFVGTREEAEAFVMRANEHRRHLTEQWLADHRKSRIERVAAARAEGKSLRAIAEEEKVSVAQVRDDIETATVQGGCTVEPPDGKVTGRDGRVRTATPAKPEKPLCPRCDRAKRTGQEVPKNCEMCRDLREPKPHQEKQETPDKVVVDAFGTEVPKKCRAAFCDPWIQQSIDFIAVVEEKIRQERLADGMLKRKKHYPFFNHKDFVDGVAMAMDTLDKLLEHLKEHRPAAVCPLCSGTGCADCRMTGLVSRVLHEKLTSKP